MEFIAHHKMKCIHIILKLQLIFVLIRGEDYEMYSFQQQILQLMYAPIIFLVVLQLMVVDATTLNSKYQEPSDWKTNYLYQLFSSNSSQKYN